MNTKLNNKTIILTFFTAILFVCSAQAATFTVTKTADTNDGVCDADCSFREAILAANNNTTGGVETIIFSTFFNTPQTISLDSTLQIMSGARVDVIGQGNHNVTFRPSGTNNGTLIFVGADARFVNLRFADSRETALSSNDSSGFSIDQCLFENNSAREGGAVSVLFGALTITNSTFRNNISTTGLGGAVYTRGSRVDIRSSTFNDNSGIFGSALYLRDSISGDITNSTFYHNLAVSVSENSSTIFSTGLQIRMTNVTVVDNINSNAGAAVFANNFNGIALSNSIISGGSLLTTNTISVGPNLIGGNPLLSTFGANGGETETLVPQIGSSAIDSGTLVSAPNVDQRGAARPQGLSVDIGAVETGVSAVSGSTTAGSSVTTVLGSVSVTFSNVTTAGTTTQIPISPASAGTLPGGFSLGSGLPAFQVSTTASYTPPITICFQVPGNPTVAVFNALTVFHSENGVLVDRTFSRNFATQTICAQTTSLSPFVVAQNLGPTAASVSISGNVRTPEGRGLRNVIVVLADQNGSLKSARTNGFGNYHFDEVPVGLYTISVSSKQYNFSPQTVSILESLQNVDFVGDEY